MKNQYLTLGVVLFLVFITGNITAQAPQNHKMNWHYSVNSGLDFRDLVTPPLVQHGPRYQQSSISHTYNEASSSMSDDYGNLIFYADPENIYDKDGNIMQGGSRLMGENSSFQGLIIVPVPCSKTKYYVFSVSRGNLKGYRYHLVNLDDNNDGYYDRFLEKGTVVSANNLMPRGSSVFSEKLTAIKKDNSEEYWLITQETKGVNRFYVHQVTQNGVFFHSAQSVGPLLDNIGYIKVNQQHDLLAVSSISNGRHLLNGICLYDFDNQTGIISSPSIIESDQGIGGIEFSENGLFLYGAQRPAGISNIDIYQYDVNLINPRNTIASVLNNTVPYIGMTISPKLDEIFVPVPGKPQSMGVITNINSSSPGYNIVTFDRKHNAQMGMPNFVSGVVKDKCDLNFKRVYRNADGIFTKPVIDEITQGAIPGNGGFDFSRDIEFVDFDNDGDIDVFYAGASQRMGAFYYKENIAGAGKIPRFGPSQLLIEGVSTPHTFRVLDIDGDGLKDIFYIAKRYGNNPSKEVRVARNIGGYFSWSNSKIMAVASSSPLTNNDQYFLSVGDLNGDESLDLLVGDGDRTYFYKNTLPPNTFPTTSGSWCVPEPTPFYSGTPTSQQCPEIYDRECDNKPDVFISEPLPGGPITGGRMNYFDNSSGWFNLGRPYAPSITNNSTNQFGLNDVVNPNNRFNNSTIVTRIVDLFNDDCPIALSYNPSTREIYYQNQECVCSKLHQCDCGYWEYATIFDITDPTVPLEIYPRLQVQLYMGGTLVRSTFISNPNPTLITGRKYKFSYKYKCAYDDAYCNPNYFLSGFVGPNGTGLISSINTVANVYEVIVDPNAVNFGIHSFPVQVNCGEKNCTIKEILFNVENPIFFFGESQKSDNNRSNGSEGSNPQEYGINQKSINNLNNDYTVFPNPTANNLTIFSAKGSIISDISIYDTKGKLLLNKKYDDSRNRTTIKLKELTPGIYFLKVNNTNTYRIVRAE